MNLPEPNTTNSSFEDEAELRDLLLFSTGGRVFAVSTGDAEGTAESQQPAPLPLAPAPILGVVYARGRMLTLIDPVALITGEASESPTVVPAIISLRGDEQLSLAADAIGETITVSSTDISSPRDDHQPEPNTAVAGILRYAGETITVLDSSRLFHAAVQRRERRRRRL
ncbi:MAG TPA: chemotaxis protein CheW [Pyrinomonadaceae bacterium]|nr:chemotaxis protein CheW [Pyrinomonadaceae bacterium]